MTEQEGRDYIVRLEQKTLKDDNYNRALEDDNNWDIGKSFDEEELERLVEMADVGNKQAMYDTAAVFTLIAHELKKQNELHKSFLVYIRALLWIDEAQKA